MASFVIVCYTGLLLHNVYTHTESLVQGYLVTNIGAIWNIFIPQSTVPSEPPSLGRSLASGGLCGPLGSCHRQRRVSRWPWERHVQVWEPCRRRGPPSHGPPTFLDVDIIPQMYHDLMEGIQQIYFSYPWS